MPQLSAGPVAVHIDFEVDRIGEFLEALLEGRLIPSEEWRIQLVESGAESLHSVRKGVSRIF